MADVTRRIGLFQGRFEQAVLVFGRLKLDLRYQFHAGHCSTPVRTRQVLETGSAIPPSRERDTVSWRNNLSAQ